MPPVIPPRTLTLAALVFVAAPLVSAQIPTPERDEKLAAAPSPRSVVVAGGCFWGIQAVFQHVRGVTRAVSGYAGGPAATAHYEMVGTGRTGHAESVEITYDASEVTLGKLLQVFFSVAHDPTQVNRQGPDEGPQYRSVIFYADAEQRQIAEAYIAQLDRAHVFPRAIATRVDALPAFYRAEPYHQDYAERHPDDPYIQINDAPKVEQLRLAFPAMYVAAR